LWTRRICAAIYNQLVIRAILLVICFGIAAAAQQPPSSGDVKVRVNYVNVCSPSDSDLKEISAVLDRIPLEAHFAPDFEVARGRTTDQGTSSDWVRMRRDFAGASLLSNVQYSISLDPRGVVETSVFRWHDPKDVLQVAIEDTVSAGTPAAVVASDTPVTRVSIERFGKSSLTMARCPQADQHQLDPTFATASKLMARYRALLGVRKIVPGELERLAAATETSGKKR